VSHGLAFRLRRRSRAALRRKARPHGYAGSSHSARRLRSLAFLCSSYAVVSFSSHTKRKRAEIPQGPPPPRGPGPPDQTPGVGYECSLADARPVDTQGLDGQLLGNAATQGNPGATGGQDHTAAAMV